MNQLLVIISIILLPGVIGTIIVDKLTVHSKWEPFKYILYSFVLGVFSYAFFQIIIYFRDFFRTCSFLNTQWTNLKIWNIGFTNETSLSGSEVIFAIVLSIPLSFFISWVINNKVLNKVGEFFKVTTKYGDENLYTYYLNTKEINWIYIRDIENNLTYQGRVLSFSENFNIQEVVLYDVTVYRYEDSAELYQVPTIYLANKAGSFRIESIPEKFLNKEEENEKETTN